MAAELKSGSMLGRYELLIRLGRGGMASVWVARERAPVSGKQRLVAVKAMLPELARHSDFRAMFLEEGQIVRAIDDVHVVKVHEVSEDRGILYMAMDWIEGDSLRTIIKEARRRRAIPAEIAVKIIADAGAGLHAAHELRGWDGELRNVVHCDVSPHNILVGLDGRAKLVDFGVANATAHSDLGSEDKIKGKFGYMSPEQASAEKLDRRSDVFALGIVLFELLTGERLFRGENAAHSLELVKKQKVPNPAELNPKLSPKLVQVVLKSLERDLDKRFQTAQELSASLERFLVEERVMVSHASVGQLVRRVLGPRIEAQRQSLREALTVSDGVVAAGLVPDQPAAPDFSHASMASSGRFPASPSEPPSQSFLSKSSTPHPQSMDLAGQRSSSVLPALVAVVGLAAAGAAVWFVNNQAPTPMQNTGADVGNTAAPKAAARSSPTYWSDDFGVAIDRIPLATDSTSASGEPGQTSSGKGAKGSHAGGTAALAAKGGTPDNRELRIENPYKVEKTDGADPVPDVSTPKADKPPPPDQRSPINRGAALAALGSASSSASGCKRPGGPSGGGSASVTFSPDGPVSAVSVSAPFGGTPVGACVQNAFRAARVPPFSGSAITLPKSFRIPE